MPVYQLVQKPNLDSVSNDGEKVLLKEYRDDLVKQKTTGLVLISQSCPCSCGLVPSFMFGSKSSLLIMIGGWSGHVREGLNEAYHMALISTEVRKIHLNV